MKPFPKPLPPTRHTHTKKKSSKKHFSALQGQYMAGLLWRIRGSQFYPPQGGGSVASTCSPSLKGLGQFLKPPLYSLRFTACLGVWLSLNTFPELRPFLPSFKPRQPLTRHLGRSMPTPGGCTTVAMYIFCCILISM